MKKPLLALVFVFLVLGGVGGCWVYKMVAELRAPRVRDPLEPRKPLTWAEAEMAVTVKVIPSRWVQIDRKQHPHASPMVSRPFTNDFVEVPIDEQGAIDEATLRQWGVTSDAVFAAARRNVREKMPWSPSIDTPGFYVFSVDSTHEPTAILTIPEKIEHLPVTGAPLIGFTFGDAVIVDSEDHKAVDELLNWLSYGSLAVTKSLSQQLVPFSGVVLTPSDGGWVEWTPPEPFATRYLEQREEAARIEADWLNP